MSEILGFGANGYRQYEGGEVPNQSNAKLIQLAEEPHELLKPIIIGYLIYRRRGFIISAGK